MYTAITITSVRRGKTKNWLKFSAYIAYLSNDRVYSFEFCGTEIVHGLSLDEEAINNLREQLCSDFGYPPYDIKKCKKLIDKIGKEYIIDC